MSEIISLIKDVGFPIAITVYLLTVFCKKLEALENVIASNTIVINKLLEKFKGDSE